VVVGSLVLSMSHEALALSLWRGPFCVSASCRNHKAIDNQIVLLAERQESSSPANLAWFFQCLLYFFVLSLLGGETHFSGCVRMEHRTLGMIVFS